MKLPHPKYLQGTKGRHFWILLGRVSSCVAVGQTNEIPGGRRAGQQYGHSGKRTAEQDEISAGSDRASVLAAKS